VKISIIIPIYNEQATLSQLLDRVEEATKNYETETILVDDCSVDGSREIILGLIHHRVNTIGVLRNINP
jgi:glycosyltransferase involved in cell wall biosynthesis